MTHPNARMAGSLPHDAMPAWLGAPAPPGGAWRNAREYMGLRLGERRGSDSADRAAVAGRVSAGEAAMLDELCAATGWHRDHARKALQALWPAPAARAQPARAPGYGEEGIAALNSGTRRCLASRSGGSLGRGPNWDPQALTRDVDADTRPMVALQQRSACGIMDQPTTHIS